VDIDLLLDHFQVSGRLPHVRGLDAGLPADVQDVVGALGGMSFDDGLYRCFAPESIGAMTTLATETFPEHAQRLVCVGADWLGRMFAADEARRDSAGQRMVLMLEPGTGQALEIPMTVTSFHERGLVVDAEPALARSFYRAWREASGDATPLQEEECIGYRLPLFLGGADEVGNLERTDLPTYWALCGQMRQQTQDVPPGTPIEKVTSASNKRRLFRRG